MTCRFLLKLTIVIGITFGLFSVEAAAWGPVAQKSIVATAFQVLGQLYKDPFKTADVNYEADVLRGAVADRLVLEESLPLNSRAEVINAIGTEIQLLREARKFGAGSYFSYRMGMLAGLVSDIMLPFSFENDPTSRRMLAQINADVDAHLKTYHMSSRPGHLEYIRNPVLYFKERSTFYNDAKTLITADYEKGRGYQGYMLKGGQSFFENAVMAVADAWYTVLRPQGDNSDIAPSSKSVTWYLVNEIQYLLTEKRNLLEAENVYRQLSALNPNDQEVYERIGDAFYAFDTKESRERGVQEWDAALSMSGSDRRRIRNKLAHHYLQQGKDLFAEETENPDAPSETLQLALNSFTKALEYDNSNEDAARLINETQVAITERNERLRLAIETVAAGEKTLKEADASMADEQYEEALAKYDKGVLVFQQVTPEFKEQAQAAKDGIETANRMISRIIRTVLDQAQDQIDEGDRLVDDKNFEDAISRYNSVETILKVVPDKEGPDAEQKKKLIEEAQNKADAAQQAKIQYDELQKTQSQKPAAPK